MEEKDINEYLEFPFRTYAPSKILHETEILNLSKSIKD